jgi:hypothetical protein
MPKNDTLPQQPSEMDAMREQLAQANARIDHLMSQAPMANRGPRSLSDQKKPRRRTAKLLMVDGCPVIAFTNARPALGGGPRDLTVAVTLLRLKDDGTEEKEIRQLDYLKEFMEGHRTVVEIVHESREEAVKDQGPIPVEINVVPADQMRKRTSTGEIPTVDSVRLEHVQVRRRFDVRFIEDGPWKDRTLLVDESVLNP